MALQTIAEWKKKQNKQPGLLDRLISTGKEIKRDPLQFTPLSMREQAVPIAKTFFGQLGKPQLGEDIGYGLRGALRLTPFQRGKTDFEPTTPRQEKAQRIGQTAVGTAMTAPLGGPSAVANIFSRAAQGIALNVGIKGVSNIAQRKPITTDIKGAVAGGLETSWQLAFTNAITDKLLFKFAPKLISSQTGNAFKLLKNASSMGASNEIKKKLFFAGAKTLFTRALAEVPAETTLFTFTERLNDKEKESFVTDWLQNLPGTVTGNLLFAGADVGLRGTASFNKAQIDSAMESINKTFKDQSGKIQLGPEGKPVAQGGIDDKSLEPLAQEARKYKSAEEFGNAIKKILTKMQLTTIRVGELQAGGITGKSGLTKTEQKLLDKYRASELTFIDVTSKTQRLTDFYNQAQKSVAQPPKYDVPKDLYPFIDESKKYKTAQEFMDAINPKDNKSILFQDLVSKRETPVRLPTEKAFEEFIQKGDPERYSKIVASEKEAMRLVNLLDRGVRKVQGSDLRQIYSNSPTLESYAKEAFNKSHVPKQPPISDKKPTTPLLSPIGEAPPSQVQKLLLGEGGGVVEPAKIVSQKAELPVKAGEEIAPGVKVGSLPEKAILEQTGKLPPVKKWLQKLSKGDLSQEQVVGKTSDDIISQARKDIGESNKKKKPLKQELRKLYTNWVNRYQPLEDVATKIEKETGSTIIPKLSPKYTTRQLMGAGGTAGLRHKQNLQPILDQIDSLKIEKADMDIFLKAKRDIGFDEVGRKVKGSDPVKARAVIKALGKKYNIADLETNAKGLYEYQNEGLKMLRDAGFIDQKGFDTIKSQNKYYAPFQRVMDEVDDYLGLPTTKAQQSTQPIKKLKGSERQIISPVESIVRNTYKIEAAVAKNRVVASLANLRKVAPEYEGLFPVAKKSSNSTITVWENGKKVYRNTGEEIASAVKGLNEESMGTMMKILSAPARLLRQGATGRNIDFMIPNVVKDQFDAAISSKYGYKPFVDYFRGLAHLINYKRTGSDKLVEGWLKSGGSIFFESQSGRKAVSEQATDAVAKKGFLRTMKKWALGGIETVGEFSETPTRLGLYKKGLEKTSNPTLAMFESREGTLDFARMGAKMKVANSIIPFLNVGVQGFDKMVRTAKGNPSKFAVKMTTYGALPATMFAIYNNLFHPEELSEIAPWEKEGNFIIITGRDKEGKPQFYKIPKGNILPYISNPVEHFITWAFGNDREGFSQMALNLMSEGLPILKGGRTPQEVASRTVGGLLPQAVKPTLENIANYSFFRGREVVPSYLKDKPKLEQTTKYTEKAYTRAGEVLNQSPLKIKNLLEGYFSGYVKVPVHIIETVISIVEGKDVNRNKIPIVRRFIGEGLPEKTTIQMRKREETKKKKEAKMAKEAKRKRKKTTPTGTTGGIQTFKDWKKSR